LPFTSALKSAEAVDAATDPDIRIRPPVANSTSTVPGTSGEADPARSGKGDDVDDVDAAAAAPGAIVTGLNTVGICVRSQSCSRQRNLPAQLRT
jgi:hypothetical protein